MVVTASLARGVVRAAANDSSRAWENALAKLQKHDFSPPATLRGFSKWFRTHNVIFEKYALLFVYGMVERRRGRHCVYLPDFEEIDGGWILTVSAVSLDCTPGWIGEAKKIELPGLISGHALERMFQRADTINWSIIRDCLAGATLFLNAVASAYLESGYKRCAIIAEKGLLVGQVSGGVLQLRTFLPSSNLNPKWQSLYDDLVDFSLRNKEEINNSALTQGKDAAHLFRTFLESRKHSWLQNAYVPGEDPLEEAWQSRE